MKTFKTLLTTLTALVVCSALLPNVAVADTTYACPTGWKQVPAPSWSSGQVFIGTNAIVAGVKQDCPVNGTSGCGTSGLVANEPPSTLYQVFLSGNILDCAYGSGPTDVLLQFRSIAKNCTFPDGSSITNGACRGTNCTITCKGAAPAAK